MEDEERRIPQDQEGYMPNQFSVPHKDMELIKWEEQYDEQINKIRSYLCKYFNDAGVEKLIEKIDSKAGKQVSLSKFEHNQIADILVMFEWDLAQQIVVNAQTWGKNGKIYDMTDFYDIVHHLGDFVFAVYQKALDGDGRRVHASQYTTQTVQHIQPDKKKSWWKGG
jgi:hypothetical protein